MSHFTYMKTRFKNLFYLEKALNRLNIPNEKQSTNFKNEDLYNVNLRIPQDNGYDIKFTWNGQEYELVADLSFWNQDYKVESFIDKVSQYYAGEVIIGTGESIGFQPVKYEPNNDGLNTIVLERWNN